MAVSVIVSNLNGRRFLPRLLDSLRGQRGATTQIIVVDRLSVDGSLAYLAEQTDVTVVQEPPETGLVSGYSAGVRYARHEHLFFCNEDIWLDAACLQRLERQIDRSSSIVAADPWQWTYDGEQLIHAGTRFRRVLWDSHCAYPFRRYLFAEAVSPSAVVPFPCAGAFLIHREAYEAVGGWDRSFFLDHEDVDLFIRVWQQGGRCVSVPNAKVYHAVGASNDQHLPAMNAPVRRRRHVSSLSSVAVIGLKYFTSIALLYPLAHPLLAVLKEAALLRPRRVWLALLAMREVIARAGAVLRFRRQWRRHNHARPGQVFFQATEFEAVSPPGA